MKKFLKTNLFKVHPLVESTYVSSTNNLDDLELSMIRYGQITSVTVVMRRGIPRIIDGISRFRTACKNPDIFPKLEYRVIENSDSEILIQRILLNETKKRGILEICKWVEHVLEIHGFQPGKKRKILGLDDVDQDHKAKLCKDRYEYACYLVKPGCSAKTLRKLMYIYLAKDSETRTQLLNNIEDGSSRIDSAFSYLKSEEFQLLKADIPIITPFQNHAPKGQRYKLLNQDIRKLEGLADNSVRLCITSPPYFNLRNYRNQGEKPLGKEATPEEYISNLVEIFREFRKKLVTNGVLVVNIGETYRNGYQGIQCALEYNLKKDGWRVIDNITWEKSNQQYAQHPLRFKNVKETILVLCKSQTEDPYFQEVVTEVDDLKSKLAKSSNLKYGAQHFHIKSGKKTLTNVIRTSVFNTKEYKLIDPNYHHEAPASEQIYRIFIHAYSQKGDTICDIFAGTGPIGLGLMMGRSVVAVDIDPKNIEFCKKRFENYLREASRQKLVIQEGGKQILKAA